MSWRPDHEELVLNAGNERLRTIVIRPGHVYGGGVGMIGDLFKAANNGLVRVVGDGNNHWPLIYERDLADLYMRIVAHEDATGVYHANDEGDERVNDIVEAISPYLALRPDVRHVPIEEARSKMGSYADALVAGSGRPQSARAGARMVAEPAFGRRQRRAAARGVAGDQVGFRRLRHEVERERQDQIDRHQLQSLHPVAFAIRDHHRRRQDRERDRGNLERVEEQRHRLADRKRIEDDRRRDQQRDLRAAADGDFNRQRHLVAACRGDRRVMLGGVADDRDEDDADEQLREPELSERRLQGADQDLRLNGREDRADGEQARSPAPAVMRGRACSVSFAGCGEIACVS